MPQKVFHNFSKLIKSPILKAKGLKLFTKNRKIYYDTTAGMTGHAIMGWSNTNIEKKINHQLKSIAHIDCKYLIDQNREKLANTMLKNNNLNLNRIFFVGCSGHEANEAAMKMSYIYHKANNHKNKKWFIFRKQSYHGSSSDTLSIGDRPNLSLFKDFHPKYRTSISEHNIYRQKLKSESIEQYENRSIEELKNKIKLIGENKISAFVGETIMGGLVGDVPPTKNYWKKVKNICEKNNIHLILDEIWCGTGTSGKYFCCEWDKVKPDFVTLGKTLSAGYAPISVVITNSKIEKKIKSKYGNFPISTSHQGHSLGVAAALAVQTLIKKKTFLNSVNIKGNFLRQTIFSELKNSEFFYNVRGRGLRNSVEYNTPNNSLFGDLIHKIGFERYNIIFNAKWHRVCFSNALNIPQKELEFFLDKFIKIFKHVSFNWKSLSNRRVNKNYF